MSDQTITVGATIRRNSRTGYVRAVECRDVHSYRGICDRSDLTETPYVQIQWPGGRDLITSIPIEQVVPCGDGTFRIVDR